MLEAEHIEHELDPSLVRTGRLGETNLFSKKKKKIFQLDFVVVLLMM
jgi:hypothetical protein